MKAPDDGRVVSRAAPAPHLAGIAADLPFLDVLAARWLGHADPAEGMILLPTRRAARALGEAFLRCAGEGAARRALLLPRIIALGALDEAPLLLEAGLSLPPPVPALQRLAVLSRLVLAAGAPSRAGPAAAVHADQAWQLARSLAELMDDAERAEVDLAARLPELAPEHAEHWQRTLAFLAIVTAHWPAWLVEQGLSNPVARQVSLLRAQARLWSQQPPAGRLWAAGFTSATPALAALLDVVARLPQGLVVLPGLDHALDEASFRALPASHPQAGLSHLLAGLGAGREAVEQWPGEERRVAPPGRLQALGDVLLPEQALARWLAPGGAAELAGLSRLQAEDQQQEAASIALILRDAIEQPGRRAALITPDRGLAQRVVVELARFGVLVDDSAGEPLAVSPAAVLLRLLARACVERLRPVPLLALLKHPYTALGRPPGECRFLSRALELACLRGPMPRPGLSGLRQALDQALADPHRMPPDPVRLERFLDDLERVLAPLERLHRGEAPVAVADLLHALLEAAESLAATDRQAGADRLWAQEDGIALAEHLAALLTHADVLPPQPPRVLGGLLDASLAGLAVRSQRALRGRGAAAEHPRIFVWGLLEARLQSVDLAVLGGLSEGVWPPATDPGPWMSRPMRAEIGLASPEQAVGAAAHDFLSGACASRAVVLSHPARREGAPAVPARWLVRLDAWRQARGVGLASHPAAGWLQRLDQPSGAPRAGRPPQPRPPVHLRPRRLSVTEIETWTRDPYAIHARHVLRLRPLKPLHEPADAADYGSIVHEALQTFLARHGADWPADAASLLRRDFAAVLEQAGLRPALAAWWRPRLLRIADWVATTEAARRQVLPIYAVGTELGGEAVLDGLPGGRFVLRGRADRIERYADGRLGLLDYKTGQLPKKAEVQEGWSSQLVLEAAMARVGGFGEAFDGETASLIYWRLTGGATPGEVVVPVTADRLAGLVAQAWQGLAGLVRAYDDPRQAYLSQPRPGRAPSHTDYALLARVAEWSAAREDGE